MDGGDSHQHTAPTGHYAGVREGPHANVAQSILPGLMMLSIVMIADSTRSRIDTTSATRPDRLPAIVAVWHKRTQLRGRRATRDR